MKMYLNESIVSCSEPQIYGSDRGFLLGDGLFETIRAEKDGLLFFDQHYERLKKSADKLYIPFFLSFEQLKKRCLSLLEANKLNELAFIRITLTRGESARGINIPEEQTPLLLITASKYTAPENFYPKAYVTDVKRNQFSVLSKLKTLNYLEPVLARQQANLNHYDEGIMLNINGAVTEASVANVFAVIDNKIYTPPVSDGVLPGIIRQVLIDCLPKYNMTITEKTLFPSNLLRATEVFQTNSLIEIQSLFQVNGHFLSYGKQAKLTEAVIKAFSQLKKSFYSN